MVAKEVEKRRKSRRKVIPEKKKRKTRGRRIGRKFSKVTKGVTNAKSSFKISNFIPVSKLPTPFLTL